MCIKFDHNQRWGSSKQYLLAAHKVSVHFSENHINYMAAYRYICKSDRNLLLSPDHPDLNLTMSPQTSCVTKELQRRRRSSTNEKSTEPLQKTKHYSKAEIVDIIKDESIKNESKLLALEATKTENDLMSLKDFVTNIPQKVYRKLIAKTWAMTEAEQVVQRKSKSCIAHLQSFLQNSCDPGCKEKTWLNMDLKILRNRDVNKFVFAVNFGELLWKGRDKNHNLIITGSSSCGKTFILNSFNTMFDTFVNPSSCKYALVAVKNKKLMPLNDLQWTPE